MYLVKCRGTWILFTKLRFECTLESDVPLISTYHFFLLSYLLLKFDSSIVDWFRFFGTKSDFLHKMLIVRIINDVETIS